MAVASITRIRLRGRRFIPFFLIHAQRCLVQIRRSDGYLAGAVCRDSVGAYWTATMWRDEPALLAYVTSGAHRNAMPKLVDWAAEATIVRWAQDTAELPKWHEAAQRMRQDGTGLALRPRDPDHADIGFADIDPTFSSRI